MTKFKELKYLVLRQHKNITKASIPYFNQMQHLESLNITKTKITLSHLCEHLNNQSLKEVFLDSEEDEKDIEEKALLLKERMPNCNIYLDTSDPDGEKPIFF
jgi:AmiR/NasT family two-component response regulator